MTRKEMYEHIVELLGGRAAEEIIFRDISTGASNDIDRASQTARDMVARYGMSPNLGTISYLSDDEVFIGGSYGKTKSYSEQVAGKIDDEVKSVIDAAYGQALKILTENRDKLETVTQFLLKHENMTGDQFRTVMNGESLEEPEA